MRTRPLFFLAVAVSAAATAQASYSDLSREFDGYEPPALYSSQAKEAGARSVSAGPAQPDTEFQAQVDRLRELKNRWEEALLTPQHEETFYTPDAALAESLRAAAEDEAVARKAVEGGYSLETLETLALLRNPAVRSKEREVRAALQGYSQVENLDTLLRRYATFNASLMTGVGTAENPDSPALKFPFPGVLALKGEAVTQDVKAVREEWEAARRDAVTSVRKAYRELLYVGKAREITERMLDLLDNLKGVTSARYQTGETSFQDVVRVGIEREKAKEELKTLAQEQRNTEAEIRMILNLAPSTALGAPAPRVPDQADVSEEGLYAVAREKRQEIKTVRAMIGKMERMLEMSETMIYPGFSLNLSLYEKNEIARVGEGNGMGASGGSFPVVTTASMGEGLPKMPWYGKDDAYLRETRQRIEALKRELEMTQASTSFGVRRAWFQLDKAKREEALFGDRVVSLSQAALEASTRGYSAGKVMFSDLIESYTGWLEANLSLERARSDLGIARAELEAAVGTTSLK